MVDKDGKKVPFYAADGKGGKDLGKAKRGAYLKKKNKYKHGGSIEGGKKLYSYHNDGPHFDSPEELMSSDYWADATKEGAKMFEYKELPSGKIELIGEVPLMGRQEDKSSNIVKPVRPKNK